MPFDVIAEVRDPIHGFIEVSPHERRIIDTPEFQRLRRIHQLGLTHYYDALDRSRAGMVRKLWRWMKSLLGR